MQVVKLFGFRDRNESHAKLVEVLASGKHPRACCMEDENNLDEPYTVWSEGPEPYTRPPDPPPQQAATEEELLDRLAAKVLAHIDKKTAQGEA